MACATLKRSLDWEPVLGGRPAKRRRCVPFCSSPTQSGIGSPGPSSSPTGSSSPKSSVFPDVLSKTLTPENLIDNLKTEIKRLQKRKQLQYNCMETSDGSSSGGESSESPSRSEKPLFTFRQVGMICERMLREREVEIREEYDNVLTAKLSEQYDAFVKFTYDQIHRNYTNTAVPSYLS
ncbi:akirin [Diabrotica virgifera virgifera]|uniref:Akirin n=1 Tax=Diabrotica virgifera virgifera TaxID=50390 RepID=A0A6P7FTV9_DIAVI|nr:akirin [Diabrotica virgifera virgifera]